MIQGFPLKCLLLVAAFSIPVLAQETIFNVPSGDILDKVGTFLTKARSTASSTSHISGTQVLEPIRRA